MQDYIAMVLIWFATEQTRKVRRLAEIDQDLMLKNCLRPWSECWIAFTGN